MKAILIVSLILLCGIGLQAQKQYPKEIKYYKQHRNHGIASTVLGAVFITGGVVLITHGLSSTNGGFGEVYLLIGGGFIALNAGIPFLAVGIPVIINNNKALKSKMNLSFGITNNGIGLIVKL